MFRIRDTMDDINARIKAGEELAEVDLLTIIEIELSEWRSSEKRQLMLEGERYYINKTAIQDKTVKYVNRSNVKLEHAFLKKLVDQKTAYLLSQPPSINSLDENYEVYLNEIFDDYFLRTLKHAGKDAINKGVGWIQMFIDKKGKLKFMQIPSEQVIPLWTDATHTSLNAVIRVYPDFYYTKTGKREVQKVQYWDGNGVKYFEYNPALAGNVGFSGGLVPDIVANIEGGHFTKIINGKEVDYGWKRPPFIPVKYNDEELPLLNSVKSLIDDYNKQASVNSDLLVDLPNLIFVLKNYGGGDIDKFIKDLNEIRAIELGEEGSLSTVNAEPNTQALEMTLERIRRAIFESARGVDTQNENLGSSSGIALQYRFADLDGDMNAFARELEASFQDMLYFADIFLYETGKGDYYDTRANIDFNRVTIVSRVDEMKVFTDSWGRLSDKTAISLHPDVKNANDETEQIRLENELKQAEQIKRMKQYQDVDYDHTDIEAEQETVE